MENSFLKDAIDRIVELATPFTLETRDGHRFCSADLVEVKPEVELPERYSVDTLEALVKLSRIDVNQGVSSVDNGISQEVSVRTGAVLKEQQTVQPIVHLQPYRTFLEVEQPASDFLLRLDKDGHPALYEADGGAWKLEAKRNIAAYLGEQLADLVERGSVVVMI